jgi:hypothetical protein
VLLDLMARGVLKLLIFDVCGWRLSWRAWQRPTWSLSATNSLGPTAALIATMCHYYLGIVTTTGLYKNLVITRHVRKPTAGRSLIGLSERPENAPSVPGFSRLCESRFSAGTEVNREGDSRKGFYLSTEQSLGKNEFIISGGHMTGGSRYVYWGVHAITLPADATPAERAHAFAYDLSCLTKVGGCRDISQVLALKTIRQDWNFRYPN